MSEREKEEERKNEGESESEGARKRGVERERVCYRERFRDGWERDRQTERHRERK